MKEKRRLDILVSEKYPSLSRRVIQSLIMQGKVRVGGVVQTKPGTMLTSDVEINVEEIKPPKFVSRGGFKLEKALNDFAISVGGLIVLDSGVSTGGFADCLLQRGAKRVYGVDVGRGQISEKLRDDPRLVLLERTNLRHLEQLDEKVDMVTLDLSFISVLKVMDAVSRLAAEDAQLVVLIKPQFEAKRHQIGAGGIVRNPDTHKEVIEKITTGISQYGWRLVGVTRAPKQDPKGNQEFLAYFVRP